MSDLCIECVPRHGRHQISSCDCGCGYGFRQYFSEEEEVEALENYKEQLKKEIAGVDDKIKKLKKE